MTCVGVAWKVSPNWSQETIACHSSNCFSIAWSQGNAPLATSLLHSCYMACWNSSFFRALSVYALTFVAYKAVHLILSSLPALIDASIPFHLFVTLIYSSNLFVLETEYKKAKQELKKATAETHKLQKKVKKGELGERSSFETLQPMHANFKVYTISHIKPHALHIPEVNPFSVAWSH